VFPGASVVVSQGSEISGVYKGNEPILFSILGCVDYTYADKKHGQTGFRTILGQVHENQIFGIPFVEGSPHPYEEPIPLELLTHGYPATPPLSICWSRMNLFSKQTTGGTTPNSNLYDVEREPYSAMARFRERSRVAAPPPLNDHGQRYLPLD
jgi:hypothetical protein